MNTRPTWLDEQGLQHLFAAIAAAGGEARAVGGAVRDFLMGREGGDIDVASSLRPQQMMELAAQQGWKAIPTGIAHGTVTLVLPERTVEVTTLRRDVETNGRHATVAFTDSFEEDAARRDFTINALSMDAQGRVYDYFDGRRHLAAQEVVFIGDAAGRIAEDGLRILRYFRFLATHGKPPANEEALVAIRMHREMIEDLSGERIATEMQKLLTAAQPLYALEQMAACSLPFLVTGDEWELSGLQRLLQLETLYGFEVSAWVRALALLRPLHREDVVQWTQERWKLSRAERTLLRTLAEPLGAVGVAQIKEWLRTLPAEAAQGRLALAAVDGVLVGSAETLVALLHGWPIPEFPVTAHDLMARGFSEGVALGTALRQLEAAWVASGYTLGKEMLLQQLS